MTPVQINIDNDENTFFTGDTVTGTVLVSLPDQAPLSSVLVSFHCVGEVKWTDQALPPVAFHLAGRDSDNNSRHEYHESIENIAGDGLFVDHSLALYGVKKLTIPFEFEIPKEKQLPSSIICRHGSIRYFIRVQIRDGDEVKKFMKELIVHSPVETNLMLSVGATAEKSVLLHGGKVSMNASISRKGYAPGDRVSVNVVVNNQTNTTVTPRVTLHQLQIYTGALRHHTLERTVNSDGPITGSEMEPHTEVEEELQLPIPIEEPLSLKSSSITVKYFVHVTLDIPHSFDLHVNLPIVLTSRRFIENI